MIAVLIMHSTDCIKLCEVNLSGHKCNACSEFVCYTVLANKRGILPNLLCAFALFRLLHVTSSLQQSEGWHRPVCLLPAHTERNWWPEIKSYYYNTLGGMHVMSPVLHTWINEKKRLCLARVFSKTLHFLCRMALSTLKLHRVLCRY